MEVNVLTTLRPAFDSRRRASSWATLDRQWAVEAMAGAPAAKSCAASDEEPFHHRGAAGRIHVDVSMKFAVSDARRLWLVFRFTDGTYAS
jgi:hypothetical protein